MDNMVSIDKVVDSMEFITLADMQLPINISRVIIDDYDNVERDLCVFLVQSYYNQIIEDAGNISNRHGKEKALVYAKWWATRRLSSEKDGLSGLVERSKLFMLEDAESTGWHHALEYDNVAELLASIMEGKEGSDEAYDWKFIVEQLIPAAKEVGIPAKMIMDASVNVKKIRGMVPAARELLERYKNETIDPEEAQMTLEDWLHKAVNKDTTYAGFQEELNQWRGKSVNRKQELVGYKIMMPDGKFMMVIPTEADRDVSMVEQALKNRVSFSITGFDWLQAKVMGQTKKYRLQQEKLDREHEQELISEMRAEMQKGPQNNGE